MEKAESSASAKPANPASSTKVKSAKAGKLTTGFYNGIRVCDDPKPFPKRSPYTKKELRTLKEMLERERDDAIQALRRLNEAAFNAGGEDRRTPGYSNDPTDYASDYAAAETSFGLRDLEETRLQQVEEALQRMEEGVYGICVASGDKIGMERLLAKPFAVLTIDCRETYERKRARGITSEEE